MTVYTASSATASDATAVGADPQQWDLGANANSQTLHQYVESARQNPGAYASVAGMLFFSPNLSTEDRSTLLQLYPDQFEIGQVTQDANGNPCVELNFEAPQSGLYATSDSTQIPLTPNANINSFYFNVASPQYSQSSNLDMRGSSQPVAIVGNPNDFTCQTDLNGLTTYTFSPNDQTSSPVTITVSNQQLVFFSSTPPDASGNFAVSNLSVQWLKAPPPGGAAVALGETRAVQTTSLSALTQTCANAPQGASVSLVPAGNSNLTPLVSNIGSEQNADSAAAVYSSGSAGPTSTDELIQSSQGGALFNPDVSGDGRVTQLDVNIVNYMNQGMAFGDAKSSALDDISRSYISQLNSGTSSNQVLSDAISFALENNRPDVLQTALPLAGSSLPSFFNDPSVSAEARHEVGQALGVIQQDPATNQESLVFHYQNDGNGNSTSDVVLLPFGPNNNTPVDTTQFETFTPGNSASGQTLGNNNQPVLLEGKAEDYTAVRTADGLQLTYTNPSTQQTQTVNVRNTQNIVFFSNQPPGQTIPASSVTEVSVESSFIVNGRFLQAGAVINPYQTGLAGNAGMSSMGGAGTTGGSEGLLSGGMMEGGGVEIAGGLAAGTAAAGSVALAVTYGSEHAMQNYDASHQTSANTTVKTESFTNDAGLNVVIPSGNGMNEITMKRAVENCFTVLTQNGCSADQANAKIQSIFTNTPNGIMASTNGIAGKGSGDVTYFLLGKVDAESGSRYAENFAVSASGIHAQNGFTRDDLINFKYATTSEQHAFIQDKLDGGSSMGDMAPLFKQVPPKDGALVVESFRPPAGSSSSQASKLWNDAKSTWYGTVPKNDQGRLPDNEREIMLNIMSASPMDGAVLLSSLPIQEAASLLNELSATDPAKADAVLQEMDKTDPLMATSIRNEMQTQKYQMAAGINPEQMPATNTFAGSDSTTTQQADATESAGSGSNTANGSSAEGSTSPETETTQHPMREHVDSFLEFESEDPQQAKEVSATFPPDYAFDFVSAMTNSDLLTLHSAVLNNVFSAAQTHLDTLSTEEASVELSGMQPEVASELINRTAKSDPLRALQILNQGAIPDFRHHSLTAETQSSLIDQYFEYNFTHPNQPITLSAEALGALATTSIMSSRMEGDMITTLPTELSNYFSSVMDRAFSPAISTAFTKIANSIKSDDPISYSSVESFANSFFNSLSSAFNLQGIDIQIVDKMPDMKGSQPYALWDGDHTIYIPRQTLVDIGDNDIPIEDRMSDLIDITDAVAHETTHAFHDTLTDMFETDPSQITNPTFMEIAKFSSISNEFMRSVIPSNVDISDTPFYSRSWPESMAYFSGSYIRVKLFRDNVGGSADFSHIDFDWVPKWDAYHITHLSQSSEVTLTFPGQPDDSSSSDSSDSSGSSSSSSHSIDDSEGS